MNKRLLLTLLALLPALASGQGLIFDPVEFSRLPKAPATDGAKDLSTLPLKVDLTPFVPALVRQGESDQTCVAIATAVYAVATQRAAELNATSPRGILMNYALSPMHAFASINPGKCQEGVKLAAVANFLHDQGGIPFQALDAVQCSDGRISDALARSYERVRVREVQQVFLRDKTVNEAVLLYDIKKHLSEKRPVVVGLPYLDSFRKLSREQPFYVPMGETQLGHAVAIIGFDDTRQAFKFVNSYGPDWGEGGYFWMRYRDFTAHVREAFVMHLYPSQLPSQSVASRQLGGTFTFKSITYSDTGLVFTPEVPRYMTDGLYQLDRKNWPFGQQFQLFAENSRQNEHICVFSINDKNVIKIHWPRDIRYGEQTYGIGESDLAGPNAQIVIPRSDSVLVISKTGTDYLCILYGLNAIKPDLQAILHRIESSSGTIQERVQKALGARLIRAGVTYAPASMTVKATPQKGDIVPLILEVKSN